MKIWRKINTGIKAFYNNLNQLSLQKKLIGLYIIVIIIPIISFTLYYTKDLYNRAIQDITHKNQYLLEIEKVHIMNNIKTMRRTAQMVVSDREFIDFVKTRNETNIHDLIDFKMNALANVLKLKENNPTIEEIHLYTVNPYIMEMWPILFKEDRIINKPWRREVIDRNGMELWWLEQQDKDILNRVFESNATISVFRELDYPKNEHLGIIEISMLQKNFFPNMFSSVNEWNSGLIAFDANMNVIYDAQNEFLQNSQLNFTKLKEHFHETYENIDKRQTTSFQFMNGKMPFLVVSTYLDGVDFYMLSITSLENIYAETKRTRNLVLGGIIFLVLMLSTITIKLISYLLKKMYILMESMKKVEKGDFNIEFDVNDRGEIGQLATHFRNMLRKINRLIDDAVHKQAVTKEAELRALKTQIDSHFLYNTLENIKMMAEIEGKYDISDAVTTLGEMMRYNMKWKTDFVLLKEEITHIENYVNIMNLRLDGCLLLKIDVPEDLLEREVLKMSLQPIVENAIKHGIRPNMYSERGIIEIKANINNNDYVSIEIIDNGIGMTVDEVIQLNEALYSEESEVKKLTNSGSGIGLKNVNERIQLHYGKDYGLTVQSVQGKYTKVIVTVPCVFTKGVR